MESTTTKPPVNTERLDLSEHEFDIACEYRPHAKHGSDESAEWTAHYFAPCCKAEGVKFYCDPCLSHLVSAEQVWRCTHCDDTHTGTNRALVSWMRISGPDGY